MYLNKNRATTVWLGLLLFALSCHLSSAAEPGSDLVLWFDCTANQFTQSLPLGNGRLGAMVFGDVANERIILNESSLWSGSKQDADRRDGATYLAKIRRLLIEVKNAQAEQLVYEHFTC